jgi:hypothetical protein
VFDNVLNFNDNPLVNNVISYVFVLLEKRALMKQNFGVGFSALEDPQAPPKSERYFAFFD